MICCILILFGGVVDFLGKVSRISIIVGSIVVVRKFVVVGIIMVFWLVFGMV